MVPHIYGQAESNQFQQLMQDLAFLGQRGCERIEIVKNGQANDFTLRLKSAPGFWGRVIERIFGKKDTLKRDVVAAFVNDFIVANRATFENADRFIAHSTLTSMRHRFSKIPQLCMTVDTILTTLNERDQLQRTQAERARQSSNVLEGTFGAKMAKLQANERILEESGRICDQKYAAVQAKLTHQAEESREEANKEADKILESAVQEANKAVAERKVKAFFPVPRNREGFAEIYADNAQKDLAIVCKDNEIVLAHSVFLKGLHAFDNQLLEQSEVDKRKTLWLLSDEMTRCRVDLKDFSREAVEYLVRYQYGIASLENLPVDHSADLYVLTDLVRGSSENKKLDRLLKACDDKIVENLDDFKTALDFLKPPFSNRIQEHALSLISKTPAQPLYQTLWEWAAERTNNDATAMQVLLNAPISEGANSLLDYVAFEEMDALPADLAKCMSPEKLASWNKWFSTEKMEWEELNLPRARRSKPGGEFAKIDEPSYDWGRERQFNEGRQWKLFISQKDCERKTPYHSLAWRPSQHGVLTVENKVFYNKEKKVWEVFARFTGSKDELDYFYRHNKIRISFDEGGSYPLTLLDLDELDSTRPLATVSTVPEAGLNVLFTCISTNS